MPGLMKTQIKSLPFLHRGKVRDIYAVGDDKLLVVQTDRLSAFDVIMEDPIPNKGRILTAMSNFWFKKFGHLMPNHMTDIDPESLVAPHERDQVRGRAIVVKKYKAIPIEAIVRGYIIGTGWKDYQQTGAICGIKLPAGLKEAQKLPEVIFTPSTKADVGEHDQNISFEKMKEIVGAEVAEKVREMAITLYREAAEFAATKGILIADTKFEFGEVDGKVILVDEVLTPDSSRFWPADQYRVGSSPVSLDKQFVRDYLETLDWNKTAPGPVIPADVVEKTSRKYLDAYRMLTGRSLR